MCTRLTRSTFVCGEPAPHSALEYVLQRFYSLMHFHNESVFTVEVVLGELPTCGEVVPGEPPTCGEVVPGEPPTCGKVVLDLEAQALQLVVTVEAHPHEAPAGEHQARGGRAAEAVDEGGEAEGPVAHLDVVEAALERRLDVEAPVEVQLYPLPR